MTLNVGARVGAYEVVALLGRGGMGDVWRARDLTLRRDVALKVVSGELARTADGLARFEREAQLLASLNPRWTPKSGHHSTPENRLDEVAGLDRGELTEYRRSR
jgi:serine/threonine protein kinase